MKDEEDEDLPSPPTIFIHRSDTYFGKILAQHLGTTVPGPTEEPEDAEDQLITVDFLTASSAATTFPVTAAWRPLTDPQSVVTPPNQTEAPILPAVKSLIRFDDERQRNKLIEDADVCIFNIFEDNAVNQVLRDAKEAVLIAKDIAVKQKKKKTFILLSTTMTWALTKKPGDNTEKDTEKTEDDEEEEGLTEETFRKRRTHPAYRYHLELEKDVLKYGSDHPGQLTTAVVAVGLVYGLGEDTLHWMLRDAWEGRDAVRLPGEGKIRTPMIHARDLCQIVQSFCENKPSRRYLVGVDSGSIKFQKIAEAVSVNLGSGFVENINPSKLLTLRLIDQVQFDILTTDLHFTPGIVKSDMKFTWTAETGILDALQKVIQEYRLVRRLTPIRILVAGPPFTGKTQLSHRLCDHYHLHYLDVHEVVETALTALRKFIDSETKRRAALTEDELENEPEEESSRLETSQELMIKIEESQEKDGKIGETFVIRFVKETLASNPSKNQGFVLDNFPDTFGHAKLLFGADRGEDDEEEEAESNHDDEFGSAPVPEFVFYLDSPEELIRKMVMERPDEPGPTAAPTSEDRYRSRLKEYHETHPGNENGVVKYCDEHSHPVHFLDRAHVDPELTFQTAVGIVGPPHNYGLSKEDRLEELRKDQEKERKRREEEEKIRKMNEREFLVKRQKNCAEWAMKLEDHHRLRGQQVQEGTANVRDYLLKNVLPQLQAGLLEAARVRPEDPVDFLGEFLLQLANPERAQPPLTTNQKLARASRF